MASKTGNTKSSKKSNTKKTTAKKTSTSKKSTTKRTANQSSANVDQNTFIGKEITIWITLAVSIFLMISNFGFAGFVGEKVSGFMLDLFGLVGYFFPILLFCGVSFIVSNSGNHIAYIKLSSGIILSIQCCVLFDLMIEDGGLIGSKICKVLEPAIGTAGTYLVSISLSIICIVLITEKSILGGVRRGSTIAYDKAKQDMIRHKEEAAVKREERNLKRANHAVSGVALQTMSGTEDGVKRENKKADVSEDSVKAQEKESSAFEDVVINRAMPLSAVELIPEPEPIQEAEEVAADSIEQEKNRKPAKVKVDVEKEVQEVEKNISNKPEVKVKYKIPPMSLLKRGNQNSGDSDIHLRETAMKLQKTLETFGVNVTITNISCGPSVTRYELQPELGVKVSKIVGLADDIKLNLAAADIRIEAPIPGKAAVGIEVPNKENSIVMLRDLLESPEFKNSKSKISFATGRDIGGKVVVSDIAKMPHLLVAGATGSGKSVCINTLIMSIIYKADPEEVKLIMIDPKVVELSVYNGIPHLMIPVVTDPKKAAGALNWAVAEMTKRYQLFAEYNVRDLKGYNQKVDSVTDINDPDKPKKMPQLVIIVDELADLMMVAPGEVEEAICRLAQLARAAGIHLVLATQRPSVNVITGLIKANMPSRIAFSVSSGVDSRTIIDMNGAEKLLGKGDMLFYPQGYQKPVRVQGAFVSDQEVQAVVEYLKKHYGNVTYDETIQTQVNSNIGSGMTAAGSADERDVYFADAGKFVIEKDKASIGMLQRVFKIGFNRAARIMDQLADAGVVGEEEGTKPRKVLMSPDEFQNYIDEYL